MRFNKRRGLRIYLPIMALLACGLAIAQEVTGGAGQDWPMAGHDAGAMRYSPLDQINRANVARLERAWTYEVPTTPNSWLEAFESTPLMVDDALYFATQTGLAVSLDAETGKQLWTFNPYGAASGKVRPLPNRGMVYWRGKSPETCDGRRDGDDSRIFYATPDARLFALDPATGKPCKGFGQYGSIDLREGVAKFPKLQYDLTSPPVIYKDLIITGSEVQEYPSKGNSGAVRAFNVRTGKLVWTFNTIPQPGEFGHETWEGDSWKDRAGVNAWPPLSVDVENGLVFLPVCSPSYDFYGADRKGNTLFANSLVAVKAETGKMVWHYQMVHHDIWDMDVGSQPTLVTLHRDGKEIPAVVVVAKEGLVFVFNRLTGKPVYPIEERAVPQSKVPGEATSPTQPFPAVIPPLAKILVTRDDITNVTPESRKYCMDNFGSALPARIFNPWGLDTTVIIPGTMGGTDWGGVSFDPNSGTMFANSTNLGAVGMMKKQPEGAPEAYEKTSKWGSYARFEDENHYPCQQPPWGTMNAVDLNTGRIAWSVTLGVVDALAAKGVPKTGIYNLGGSIVTAGGLVFIAATADRRFRAFDARDGKELWVSKLEANGYATPLTYLGKRTKKQFVAIAVGPSSRFSTGASAPTVVAAYTLFPEGQTSPAQAKLQTETRLPVELGVIPGGVGREPVEITPPPAAPSQPIPFSHRVHLTIGLPCNSCHQVAADGKQMQIPNVTQCMACHQGIATDRPAIQKLASIAKAGGSIPWVRVNHLPDFVFFSHQKHMAAKVDCAVCHGMVRNMDAMRQVKDMSMMSCVNCHNLRKATVSCGQCHNIGY
ncbi:MAG: quinoprotein glucose dehydrogenase [Acidobacteria bacterium]|nr:MAG: quinoprotein glucose dehydrogenase [Acidobacteriota bacterium]